MQNLPWARITVTICVVVYMVFLGIASFSSSLVPQMSYGVYEAIVGNSLDKLPLRGLREQLAFGNALSASDDAWDKCELPKYDVWDDELIPYLNPDKNPIQNCDKSFKPFTKLANSSWSIVNKKKDLVCKTRCHSRKNDRSNIIGNWSFAPGPVNCEFLEAVCSEGNNDVYGYLHSQIIPKPIEQPKIDTTGLMQFDVFVILLDSLSYSQAKRSLSRTLSYFQNHMDGVIFPYMNKIGDNSRPNGIPLWFGKSLEPIDKTLFDEGVTARDWSFNYFCKVFKDNETSLFSEFQDYGYRTLLAEDWAEGTMNWPGCVGFDKPPIDHYMRPFQNAYERRNHGKPITQKHLKDGHLCREYHHTLLDYMGQFTEAYPNQRKFGWMWAIDLGHNTENGFAHADKDFQRFLINHRAQLEKSFVFILGDHGLRFGKIRDTFVGALDVNNPFTAVSIPKSLRTTTGILDIMAENAKKIQSHYDTRATILDIMKYQSANKFMETEPKRISGEKGYSYIRKQPEEPRNCRNMPVPLEYCICQFQTTPLATDTNIAKDIGVALTETVNIQLAEGNFTDKCIKMEYDKTLSLQMYDHQYKGATLYKVTAVMKEPSKAEFKGNVKVLNGEILVLGMVERSNKYGKTAECVRSEYHRPYCYCRDQGAAEKKPKG